LKACISCGTVPEGAFRQTAHLFSKEAKMPMDLEELKRKLLQTDDEFRQLATQHHSLDEQIQDMAAHHLSEPQQLEELTLKKRKLQLKDQMEMILRRSAEESPTQAAGH